MLQLSRCRALAPGSSGERQPRAGVVVRPGCCASRLIQLRCQSTATVAALSEDKWIAKTLAATSQADVPTGLEQLRGSCLDALRSTRMPTSRNEEYRFTDLAPLTGSSIQPAAASASVSSPVLDALSFPEASGSLAVVLDGQFRRDLSRLQALPADVYIGGLEGAPEGARQQLGAQSASRGGPFATLNGAVASSVLCIVLPPGFVLEQPLHLLYIATAGAAGAALSASAPRLLVVAGPGSECQVVEEFVPAEAPSGAEAGGSFTCAVAEVSLGEDAGVRHSYLQREAQGAVHFKATLVLQEARSRYSLTEAITGAQLSRHDLGIRQDGADTSTTLQHFLLCGRDQLHDLHSKVELNHPRGEANQLHKCIVTQASGRGVFDGNVRVNRLAQKTDAGQLSRNLLLVPKATVNVKPNLQIVADDVKCTHGCAVSDLSEEELFYFRARGIDADHARQALVYSFGAEVVQHLRYKGLTSRVQADVNSMLQDVEVLKELVAGA